jgi:hypothetical protein
MDKYRINFNNKNFYIVDADFVEARDGWLLFLVRSDNIPSKFSPTLVYACSANFTTNVVKL